jgi:hypothetical protein
LGRGVWAGGTGGGLASCGELGVKGWGGNLLPRRAGMVEGRLWGGGWTLQSGFDPRDGSTKTSCRNNEER